MGNNIWISEQFNCVFMFPKGDLNAEPVEFLSGNTVSKILQIDSAIDSDVSRMHYHKASYIEVMNRYDTQRSRNFKQENKKDGLCP